MSDIAIRVDGLGKQFRIGAKRERYKALRDRIADAAAKPFRAMRSLVNGDGAGKADEESTIWALKDVSFEINRGEVVGVIGRNGAGKSTLLKVLSRITEPTEGRVEIHGRVGSLLEVGTGFHPELSGRDNIFLNGAILGMRRAEIERKFDEIVAFAEVEKFIDTPVKHYSSGMYMRLAFSVAAHLEPEILLVDEVLAVGDAQFQRKCLGKMGEVARQGRTVFLVSHNMSAVRSLCSRAIVLDAGHLTLMGAAPVVITRYIGTVGSPQVAQNWGDRKCAPGDDVVRLRSVKLDSKALESHGFVNITDPLEIQVDYWNQIADVLLNVSLVLHNEERVCVFNAISPPTRRSVGLVTEVCRIPSNLLNEGTYTMRLLVVRDAHSILVDVNDVLVFQVVETERSMAWYGKWIGVVRPSLEWQSQEGGLWIESEYAGTIIPS